MNINNYKRVISKNVTVTGSGMIVKKEHKLTSREIDGVVGCINELMFVSKFSVAILVYQLVTHEIETGLTLATALSVVVDRMSHIDTVGKLKGHFSATKVKVYYRMCAMFPEPFRSDRIPMAHYIKLASAMHIGYDVAQARIMEIKNAIENPDPDSDVDTSIRRTEELIREHIERRPSTIPHALRGIKSTIAGLYKLVCADGNFGNLKPETQEAVMSVSSAFSALHSMALSSLRENGLAVISAINEEAAKKKVSRRHRKSSSKASGKKATKRGVRKSARSSTKRKGCRKGK